MLLVLDNAPTHHASLVTDYLRAIGVEVLYLPPYSSPLNCVEHAWQLYKNAFKKHMANIRREYTVEEMTHDLQVIGIRLGE